MRNVFTVLFPKASGSKQRQGSIICWGWGERKVCALGGTHLTIPCARGQEPAGGLRWGAGGGEVGLVAGPSPPAGDSREAGSTVSKAPA